MNRINIDGIETRKRIDKMVGKKSGVSKLSAQLGINDATLSKICRRGYGSEELINKYADLGVPFRYSTEPIPCRVRKEHTRRKKNATAEPIEIEPVQISMDDIGNIEASSAMCYMDELAQLMITTANTFAEAYNNLKEKYRRK